MRLRTHELSWCIGFCVLAGSTSAFADDGTNLAKAEALFAQGRDLAAQGRWAEACPKFAESNRTDPGAGTLLNLGNCYEKNNQPASAWAAFKSAAQLSRGKRPEWEAHASRRAAALEPKLARVVIQVPPDARVPGLVVTCDGERYGDGSWDAPLPMDPKEHVLSVAAPGHKAWETRFVVGAEGSVTTVTVPRLVVDDELPTERGAVVVIDRSGSGATQRILGISIGGAGVAALIAGGVLGGLALDKASESKRLCPNNPCQLGDPSQIAGFDANEDARRLAEVANIAFIGGGVALVAGSVLFLTAPRSNASEPRRTGFSLAPSFGGSKFGFVGQGTF